MIQTPVGMRCRQCAGLRRLPQYEVGLGLLLRSSAAGLVVSVLAWLLIDAVPYLRFFLAILVGLAVGEAMSRAARRRANRMLEAMAVVAIIVGALIAMGVYGAVNASVLHALASEPAFAMSLLLPIVVASFVAVIKLR